MFLDTYILVQVAFACVSVALIGFGCHALYHDSKSLRDWNRRLGLNTRTTTAPIQRVQQGQQQSWLKSFLNKFGNTTKPNAERELSKTRLQLLQAGYRNPNAVNMFYGVKFGLMILLPGLTILILFGALRGSNSAAISVFFYLYIFASALIGTLAPEMWLRFLIERRKEQIGRGFPDALDLLVLCLESGLGLDAAIYRVASDIELTHPLLSQELRLLMDSIRSGQSHQVAFTELNQRVDLDDVHSFTGLIVQTEKLGVGITQAMQRIATAMRTKRRIRAEEAAAKLPIKLLFPVTLFMFPSIIVVTLMPGILALVRAFKQID